jgi:hypothetical protein
MNPVQQQVYSQLQSLITEKPLYAIIDSAQDETIIELLHQHAQHMPIQSLYEGKQGQELALVAPYLAQLDTADNALLKDLVEQGWGNYWAIYFDYPSDFKAARNQLRQCLRVGDTDKQYQALRFYDSRVFRRMIPTFDMSQLIAFYGAIGSYWLDNNNATELVQYQMRELQLEVKHVEKQLHTTPETE